MKCPFCGFANDKVVDSRESKEADSIRRRALARLRKGLDLQWTPPSSRDEIHER
jgi:transcriptional repressor NrdR